MPTWNVSFPERLDTFLAKNGSFPSRSKAQEAIVARRVLVNEEVVTKEAMRLQEGDQVTLTSSLPPASGGSGRGGIEPENQHLQVLYEDDRCLVINKPAGIAVHPGAGMAPDEKTILHGAAWLFQERSLPFAAASTLVHRLDKETTGCLLLAKAPEAHQFLQKQFEQRSVEKTYLALVAGIPSPAAATIDSPIGRSAALSTRMSIFTPGRTRESQTSYRTLASSPEHHTALLACTLHTGRTHQIRVHLSSIGHPILGDSTYTSTLSERLSDEHRITTLCLHAWKLSFTTPPSGGRQEGGRISLTAPLPKDFSDVLRKFNMSEPA